MPSTMAVGAVTHGDVTDRDSRHETAHPSLVLLVHAHPSPAASTLDQEGSTPSQPKVTSLHLNKALTFSVLVWETGIIMTIHGMSCVSQGSLEKQNQQDVCVYK